MRSKPLYKLWEEYLRKNKIALTRHESEIANLLIYQIAISDVFREFFTARANGKTFTLEHVASFCREVAANPPKDE